MRDSCKISVRGVNLWYRVIAERIQCLLESQKLKDRMQRPIADTSFHKKSTSLRIIEDLEPYIATMKKQDPETLAHLPSYQLGEVRDDSIGITHDAVFGAITADGPNYRNAS